MRPFEPRQGAIVNGKYGLIALRGFGAMGSVWSAKHVPLGHDVAIKFLHYDAHHTSKEAIARFEREARLAARLGDLSRHIARVVDFGTTGDDDAPFLVMDLLEGEELAARNRREKRIPLVTVVEIVRQLAEALDVAHREGVIHRDVKPANVFLCKGRANGELLVKLMDFGIAKATDGARDRDDTHENTTREGTVIGTPGYMSPEQVLGDMLDWRSDLWGLAATVFRVVVGRTPFGHGSMAELGVRILTVHPKPPSSEIPSLPVAFDAFIAKGLAKAPGERFQSGRELAEALAALARTARPIAHARSAAALVTRLESRPALARTESGVRRIEGFRWRMPLRLALSFVVAAFASYVVARRAPRSSALPMIAASARAIIETESAIKIPVVPAETATATSPPAAAVNGARPDGKLAPTLLHPDRRRVKPSVRKRAP